MTDEELRALVRAAIATYAAAPAAAAPPGAPATPPRLHPSHARFAFLQAGSDVDGPCLIEPVVPCNHCGYCQSYGH